MDNRTILATAAKAMNGMPEDLARLFNMKDLVAEMNKVSPYKRWDTTTPFHSMERIVELKLAAVAAVKKDGQKAWTRLARGEEQVELPLEALERSAPTPWSRAKPNAVRDAVAEVVATLDTPFTSETIKAKLRWSDPELWRVMNPSSVSSALKSMEHKGLIERSGRKLGACIEWRRWAALERRA